jgi:hypothetical protein
VLVLVLVLVLTCWCAAGHGHGKMVFAAVPELHRKLLHDPFPLRSVLSQSNFEFLLIQVSP